MQSHLFARKLATPPGLATLVSNGAALVALWLPGQRPFCGDKCLEPAPDDRALNLASAWLAAYFAGKRPDPAVLPLAPAGSPFRQRVWRLLMQIPYGQCTTYGAIARQIASECGIKRMSAQAVGGAVGHNPIAVIIPCHRVVGSGCSIGGYNGGIPLKLLLLRIEGVDMERYAK